ncbi:hypothetical protein, partial [Ottowia sp.]|uniref:hypothetical protein n=1 Tax=Ottowia sp. TaxID=1898956 RepID=UPI003C7532B0
MPTPRSALLGTARGGPWLGPLLRSACESIDLALLGGLAPSPSGGGLGGQAILWGLSLEYLHNKSPFGSTAVKAPI